MEPISIWQPRVEDGETVFVRPDPGPLGDHYATRLRIPARKSPGTRRVCWLGESAAAGYLYAPHLTPAGLLESTLRQAGGEDRYEVVDLARTNETLSGLVDTARAAMQLSPDQLVVFAGNNWNLLETPELSPYFPSAEGRQAIARALERDGVMGVVELAGRRRLARADGALESLAKICDRASVPVVVVVPEVNLADWESRQPVAWLPADGSRLWHGLRSRAEEASAAARWPEVLRVAYEMLELDGGSCPTTYRLLAAAFEREGETGAARRAAEAEVACHQYPALCFLGAPQASVSDQGLLRAAAGRYGFSVVDLPAIFGEYGDTPLPGRRLFLDYCHLTSEGIGVAVSGVAAELLRFDGVETDWRILVLAQQLPTPEVEAVARLGAAIHTAHRMLPVSRGSPMVAYWLEAAMDASPEAADMLLDLVSARSAPLPEMLTPAQARSLERPMPLGFQHGWRYEHLDLALIAEARRVFARRLPDRVVELDRALLRHHDAEARVRELVSPPVYLWEPLARFHPEVVRFADVTEWAIHRSPWPVTELGFVAAGRQPLVLEIEARLPRLEGGLEDDQEVLEVLFDGRLVGSLRLDSGWAKSRMSLGLAGTSSVIHRLSLRWPDLPSTGDGALSQAIECLRRGQEADLHPVFGELFSVRVGPERS